MYNFKNFFLNKRVLITGHTGFKGSWLSLWLHLLGAKVVGVSINNPTIPSHFDKLNLKNKIVDIRLDIRKLKKLNLVFKRYKPDIFFHLAAQSLVKKSYRDPITTFSTNTIGTLNVLECLKKMKKKCNTVIITSDKSYKNLEIKKGYREKDLLGGKDPYSASKASAELIIQSYVNCFFKKKLKHNIAVARAGNVVGGGDWSEDRLIPDCIKAWIKNKKALIRNPSSTRPWQHVLEALRGYLILAIYLSKNKNLNGEPFNFGPRVSQDKNVISFLREMQKNWKEIKWKVKKKKSDEQESKLLKLNSEKAKKFLNWIPILQFNETAKMTISWYKDYYKNSSRVFDLSKRQIVEYSKKIRNSEKKKY